MRRMSPGGVLPGRWKSGDRKLRPGMRTPNRDHLMKMGDEMPMRKMKMKMKKMIMMLLMMMILMERMQIGEAKTPDPGKQKKREQKKRD